MHSARCATIESRRSVEVRFANSGVMPPDALPDDVAIEVAPMADGLRACAADPGALAQQVAMRSAARGIAILALNTLAPSLEEVFLHITGRTTPRTETTRAA